MNITNVKKSQQTTIVINWQAEITDDEGNKMGMMSAKFDYARPNGTFYLEGIDTDYMESDEVQEAFTQFQTDFKEAIADIEPFKVEGERQ